MRLVKRVAQLGVASRRKSDELIARGKISVNGKVVTDPAKDVSEQDRITYRGKTVTAPTVQTYVLNKPVGIVATASDPEGRRTVLDLIGSTDRLYPIGRLDYGTSGLILLSNDGELANLLTHPRYEVPKTYRVTVNGKITDTSIALLRSGIMLDDGKTLPAKAAAVSRSERSSVIELTIREGRNRQVRRMCDAIGHPVQKLERVAFGPLQLGALKSGQSRELTADEVSALRDAAR